LKSSWTGGTALLLHCYASLCETAAYCFQSTNFLNGPHISQTVNTVQHSIDIISSHYHRCQILSNVGLFVLLSHSDKYAIINTSICICFFRTYCVLEPCYYMVSCNVQWICVVVQTLPTSLLVSKRPWLNRNNLVYRPPFDFNRVVCCDVDY
jgi:hypothetical protein